MGYDLRQGRGFGMNWILQSSNFVLKTEIWKHQLEKKKNIANTSIHILFLC